MPAASRGRQAALGAVVGLIGAGLAVAGHAIVGGALPGAAPLLALSLAAGVIGAAVGQRVRGLPALLGVLVALQAAFHAAFGVLAVRPAHAGHTHVTHNAVTHSAAQSPVAHASMTGFGWQMLAGHLVAVLLTALVVRRGAQICRLLAAVLTRTFGLIRSLLTPAPAPRLAPLRLRENVRASTLPQLVLCAAPRRGPPALLAT